MENRPLTLPFGPERQMRVVLGLPRAATMDAVLILGHGANNDLNHPVLAGVNERLVREGVVTVRFNFPYAEEGRKRPDPDRVLEDAMALVLEYVAQQRDFQGMEIFLGGKSLGARIAAQLTAQGAGVSGLVFLGYPLHPPGRPDDLRDQPLYVLPCPVLFLEGSRDPFCRFDRLGEVLGRLPVRADLHVLPGLGHSYERGQGEAAPEVLDEISRVIVAWMESL